MWMTKDNSADILECKNSNTYKIVFYFWLIQSHLHKLYYAKP